jgi:hypothetical protein
MVKQEQGETLRKYMRCFFDKRATVVDVSNKEVIDLFQDALYHRRTFEDFGRHRPSSIAHLKDIITSCADEEDKANAKYNAIRSKSKQNTRGGSNNNGNQGGHNNNYSCPNRKCKPDNTVVAIQGHAKDKSKKTSGGFLSGPFLPTISLHALRRRGLHSPSAPGLHSHSLGGYGGGFQRRRAWIYNLL